CVREREREGERERERERRREGEREERGRERERKRGREREGKKERERERGKERVPDYKQALPFLNTGKDDVFGRPVTGTHSANGNTDANIKHTAQCISPNISSARHETNGKPDCTRLCVWVCVWWV